MMMMVATTTTTFLDEGNDDDGIERSNTRLKIYIHRPTITHHTYHVHK